MMPDSEDVEMVLGCVGCGFVILIKVAAIVGIAWIVIHFAIKYW